MIYSQSVSHHSKRSVPSSGNTALLHQQVCIYHSAFWMVSSRSVMLNSKRTAPCQHSIPSLSFKCAYSLYALCLPLDLPCLIVQGSHHQHERRGQSFKGTGE